MYHKWKDKIDRFYSEACDVLEEYDWPTSLEGILATERDPENHLVSYARILVVNVYKLHEEVERGRIDRALNCMLNICCHYEDLWILREIPETNNKLMASDDVINKMRKGFKRFGWQSNGGKQNAIPDDEIMDWKAQYKELLKENPAITKRAAAKIIDLSRYEIIRKKI